MKTEEKQLFSAQPPTSSTSSVCNSEVKEQMEIKDGHSVFSYFQNLNINTKKQKRKMMRKKRNKNDYHVIEPCLSPLDSVIISSSGGH